MVCIPCIREKKKKIKERVNMWLGGMEWKSRLIKE